MLIVVLVIGLLAMLPALLFWSNLRLYRPLPPALPDPAAQPPAMAVLIPARNEEAVITQAVQSALASHNVDVQVLVLDDHSTDATSARVQALAREDNRVALLSGQPLPHGWNGKQFACHQLAQAAKAPWLVFIDADVQLAKDALIRMHAFMTAGVTGLGSGVPRQVTIGLLEKLVIPIIHFLLLGFLPLGRMRQFPTRVAYAAGCGQLFITTKQAYEQAGGHADIRASRHDGIQLPRLYRRKGLATDLFDATDLASCRMYNTAAGLFMGFAKNATEGLASNLGMLLVWTVLLFGGQVMPWLLLGAWPWLTVLERCITLGACGLTLLPRWLGCVRFRQSWLGAWLHPLGILVVLVIQWFGYFAPKLGYAPAWKGRAATTPAK